MASSYSTDLKLELMVTGENAGTWGDNTNNNLNLIQQAIAGYEAIALTDGGTVALAMTDKTISTARNMVIKFTGTLTTASTVTIPDSIEKFYIFDLSAVTGVTNLTIKTVSGTGFTAGEAKIVAAYSDGTNLNEIALDTLGGTIGTAQIADNAITTAKISDNQITTAKISDNQITTAKISANQITTAKISDNQITTAKISDNQITTAKIADDAVTADKLADTAVTPGTYTSAEITVDQQGRITAASSGAGGGGITAPTLAVSSGSGTYTGHPGISQLIVYAQGGSGGGGGNGGFPGASSGSGGTSGFGVFTVGSLSAPYTQPYSVGGGGGGGGTRSPGNAGGTTNFGNLVSANGGNGGGAYPPMGGSGSPGNPGSTSANISPWSTNAGFFGSWLNAPSTSGGAGVPQNSGSNPGQPGYLVVIESSTD